MVMRAILKMVVTGFWLAGCATVALAATDDCGLQDKVPADQRVKNTVKWATASEINVFGYEVFRGETEEGSFTKLTKDPILGAGTTDVTQKYQFADDTIDPCKEYWYYVEEITTQGSRSKVTPVYKAKAKRQPGEKSAEVKPVEKSAEKSKEKKK